MAKDSIIKTGVSDYEMKVSTQPSGKNCMNGERVTTVPVPSRNVGPNSINEVTLDENAGLPEGTGRK